MEFHELANVFPMMSDEEFTTLKSDMQEKGFDTNYPILTWEDKVIDGRNRYKACIELGITPIVKKWNGETSEEALAFVIRSNLHRRHLNESQRAMVAARIANMRQGERTDLSSIDERLSQSSVATLLNVSKPSVERAVKVQREGSPDLISAVEQGKVAVSIAAVIADLPKPEQKKLVTSADKSVILQVAKEIKKERAVERVEKREKQKIDALASNPNLSGDKYSVEVCDIRKLKLVPDSIDAIITDPPYPEEYLLLYETLSKLASTCLKDDGVCIVMVGQSHLEKVLSLLSKHLTYQWTLAYLTPGASVQVFGRKIKSNWKPLIFLTKDKNKWEHIEDTITSDGRDKRFHEWGQSVEGMGKIVERFTVKGSVVFDPFCGGGATGVAALLTGRAFVGYDIDEAEVKKTAKRLSSL